MFMDTAQEKAIGLGSEYPYEPLDSGECVVPSLFQAASGV